MLRFAEKCSGTAGSPWRVENILCHLGRKTFCVHLCGKHFVSICVENIFGAMCVENIFGAICVENIFRTVRVHMDGKRFREQTMRRYFVKKEERTGNTSTGVEPELKERTVPWHGDGAKIIGTSALNFHLMPGRDTELRVHMDGKWIREQTMRRYFVKK